MQKASVVEDFLKENDWVAMIGTTNRGEIKPDTLRIRVGYKPNPYFAEAQEPEWLKRMQSATKKTLPKNKPEAVRLRAFTPFPEKPEVPDQPTN
jgi:hypothetical protein